MRRLVALAVALAPVALAPVALAPVAAAPTTHAGSCAAVNRRVVTPTVVTQVNENVTITSAIAGSILLTIVGYTLAVSSLTGGCSGIPNP